jgi:hypothetical protein
MDFRERARKRDGSVQRLHAREKVDVFNVVPGPPVERKWLVGGQTDANDPLRTLGRSD